MKIFELPTGSELADFKEDFIDYCNERSYSVKEADQIWINAMSIKEKIKCYYEYPPIPIRNFDWMCYRDGMEEDSIIGEGETMSEAIYSLFITEYE